MSAKGFTGKQVRYTPGPSQKVRQSTIEGPLKMTLGALMMHGRFDHMAEERRKRPYDQAIRKQAIKPGEPFDAAVPDLAGFDPFYSVSEAWPWAEQRVPVSVEPFHEGSRVLVHGTADGDLMGFDELGDDATDFITSPVGESLNEASEPFIVDGVFDGDTYYAKDLLYWGADLHSQPLLARLSKLLEFVQSLPKAPIMLPEPIRIARNKPDFESAAKKLLDSGADGIMSRQMDEAYPLTGGTQAIYTGAAPAPAPLADDQVAALKMLGFNVPEDEQVRRYLDNTAVKIVKQAEDRRLVYGIVLRPNRFDEEADVMTELEVEKAAHHFMAVQGIMAIRHRAAADAIPVESYIAPVDFMLGGQQVKKGDWILVSFVKSKALWGRIRSGDLRAYSPGGMGKKTKITL